MLPISLPFTGDLRLHFALICPPFKSHIAVFQAIGTVLLARGHRVLFVVNGGAEHLVSERFDVYAAKGTDKDRLDRIIARTARPGGPLGILRTVHDTAVLTEALCTHAPAHLRALDVDAVLGDQMEPAAGLVARHLGLPMISIACALPMEREDTIPLPFLPWLYDPSEKGMRRNRGGERVSRLLLSEQRRVIRKWAGLFALPGAFNDLQSCLSDTATIAQTTEEFDFPRAAGLRPLYRVGPLRVPSEGKAETGDIPFPIDTRKPFVFMSLGTLQGHRFSLFQAAARACLRLDIQLLVAHCGGLTQQQVNALDATWVVDFAPQRAVLARADLCITHGGMNTVMDALSFGVPLLALPIAFDQPGISARIMHHKVGLRLSPRLLTTARIQTAIETILREPDFALNAHEIGESISAADGLMLAADVIEDTLAGSRV